MKLYEAVDALTARGYPQVASWHELLKELQDETPRTYVVLVPTHHYVRHIMMALGALPGFITYSDRSRVCLIRKHALTFLTPDEYRMTRGREIHRFFVANNLDPLLWEVDTYSKRRRR